MKKKKATTSKATNKKKTTLILAVVKKLKNPGLIRGLLEINDHTTRANTLYAVQLVSGVCEMLALNLRHCNGETAKTIAFIAKGKKTTEFSRAFKSRGLRIPILTF